METILAITLTAIGTIFALVGLAIGVLYWLWVKQNPKDGE